MSKSLAVKYRPNRFEDVVSQESIITILKKQIELKDYRNAYLFYGSSGCGKTTVARIFANYINNGIGVPIEIDAASNNGVDNVKQIVKASQERSIDSEYKIYIIDECHALTSQAWQAFLKCIEETPKYTIFIFCTTEIQKIPATILNRVMQFNFKKVDYKSIKNRLLYICNSENLKNYDAACDFISKNCNGQIRDSISMLDKCSLFENEDLSNYLSVLNVCSYDLFFNLLDYIIDGSEYQVIESLNNIYETYSNYSLFVNQFLSMCFDISKYLICNSFDITQIPSQYYSRVIACSKLENAKQYYSYLVKKLLNLKINIKKTEVDRILIDQVFLEMTRCE